MSWLVELIKAVKTAASTLGTLRFYAELLGLNPEEVNDPSVKCRRVLEEGLTPQTCSNPRQVRRWVMCRAWQLIETDQTNRFQEAIRRAWMEAKIACGPHI